ncbi:deubiquitinating enzyme [Coemansia javaensis]|uniref:Ubiquitin carboxyl-terminal hydrolase n=1 Tax=Coemansia javaensis TaxID=2761396 RepID=A0A9W8HEY3_9FUNG|nr:deubiquitinating enzyme [Coemansia javaensis]
MAVVAVQVKWQGKKYAVDVDTAQPGEVFKMQLFSLTGVEPDRQKILVKGGQLKDDTDMGALGLKDGQVLMMMGTVGALPAAPAQPVRFVEDMTDSERAQALSIPAGLTNLGNTCYMNASLQCLRAIPGLQQALGAHAPAAGPGGDARASLVSALRVLFRQLREEGEGVAPLVFLQLLRQAFPKYAEQDPQAGGFRQQDAEEFWGELLTTLDQQLRAGGAPSFVEQRMAGALATTWTADEAPDEPATVHREPFRKLTCQIDKSVNYLAQGIKKSLEQEIEKRSETLGRNAQYRAVSRIERLPEYLTVTYNRFFWKASESVDAKIVKSVKFPLDFDAAEFCTPELQDKMRPARAFLRDLEERRAAERKQQRAKSSDASSADADADAGAKDEEKKAAPEIHPDLLADPGCNPSGMYELIGVVTHIGRTANSGHYMAWVRKEPGVGGPDPKGKGIPETRHWWYRFDDDEVSMVTDDDVLRLSGGGDWHTAYVTLYRAKSFD